jgi:hypothetical protein
MRARRLAFALFASLAAGCGSHADTVCDDIGYCRGLSSDQVKACQANGKALAAEARSSQCGPFYDAYFNCLDSNYDCQGDTPTFTGCADARQAFADCLANGRAQNACGKLDEALTHCAPPPGDTVPAPCGGADVCAASCYLSAVSDPCNPTRGELRNFTSCAASCLP